MMEDRSVEAEQSEIVSNFLASTYRLQATQLDVMGVGAVMVKQLLYQITHNDSLFLPILSGIAAELYVKTMLPCIDGIDFMCQDNTVLALPADYPAPKHLPAEFLSGVKVYEIIDSQFPSYVYLKKRYLLTEDDENGEYKAAVTNGDEYYFASFTINAKITSPGMIKRFTVSDTPQKGVPCVRCLSWPTQAADWPTRLRNYGWPDSTTVDRVVSNGCDLVNFSHSLYKRPATQLDEWTRKIQWRLSFSRAEVVLLNSWMPVQQIVYHMLRVYLKTVKLTDITDETGTQTLNSYHVKTLMLWSVELKPKKWWTNDKNVIRIAGSLLKTLVSWLTKSDCKHYFVRKCNLFERPVEAKRFTDFLEPVTESRLSMWFVNNYIVKCAQLCPANVSLLFHCISVIAQLQQAVSAIVAWRQSVVAEEQNVTFWFAELYISTSVQMWSSAASECLQWANALKTVDSRISIYFTAIVSLHCCQRIVKHGLTDDLMDIISVIYCGPFAGRRRYYSPPGSVLLLNEAAKLMKVIANNSRSTVQLIEIELSKAYLYRALRCKDSGNDSVYCLATVYLAILYYTTGQYQTAIDHCTLVTRSQDHSHVVQGELLPKVDDDIDNVLGLAVFYQHVRATALHELQQQIHVFTTDLFAHYLHIRCLFATHSSLFPEWWSLLCACQRYRRCVCDIDQSFIADVLLCKSTNVSRRQRYLNKTQLVCQRSQPQQNPTELNTSKLVELLEKSAVEHLRTFLQIKARASCSTMTIVTTDFEVMYAYKHGDYQHCLQLCIKNVHALLNAVQWHYVLTFQEFIQLIDDGIVSLFALTLVVDYRCRNKDNGYISISQLTLSLYLMARCQLKLRSSPTQLAQTLDYINDVRRKHPANRTLDRLTLKLAKRKVMCYLKAAVKYLHCD